LAREEFEAVVEFPDVVLGTLDPVIFDASESLAVESVVSFDGGKTYVQFPDV
jgi:hypothetical protein